jgi:hypothetical protein
MYVITLRYFGDGSCNFAGAYDDQVYVFNTRVDVKKFDLRELFGIEDLYCSEDPEDGECGQRECTKCGEEEYQKTLAELINKGKYTFREKRAPYHCEARCFKIKTNPTKPMDKFDEN